MDNEIIKGNFNVPTETKNHFFQIDLLKSIMIAFVIVDHSFHASLRPYLGGELWIRMAIPVFLIIMGFNMGKSFERKGKSSFKEIYSKEYFKNKFWRFIFPYIILYIVSTIIGFIIYGVNFPDQLSNNWFLDYIIYQQAIFAGPGNWFIPIVVQSIFLMPLLYKLFSKWPKVSLISCFLIEFFMHLLVFFIVGEITWAEWPIEIYFRNIILLYLSSIGLGFWFSKNPNIFSKKNWFIWIIFPFSLMYLIGYEFFDFRLAIDGAEILRGDYHLLANTYSAFIILLALKFIPPNSNLRISKAISAIGRSTFHIFLVQDIYFAITYAVHGPIWGVHSGPQIIGNIFGIVFDVYWLNYILYFMNLGICFSIGVIWRYIENKIKRIRIHKKNTI